MNPRQKHLLKTHRRKANIKEGPQNLPPITINGIVKCDVISRDLSVLFENVFIFISTDKRV